MITHVVMWNVIGDKQETAKYLKERIESMRGKVPQIVDLTTGLNIDTKYGDRDFICITRHHTVEDYIAYQEHDYHREVKRAIAEWVSDRASVDFDDGE